MLLIGRDDQPAGVALLGADATKPVVGLAEHGRQPVTVERQRCPQPRRHLVARQLVREARPEHVARRRVPLHLTVDPGKIDRSDHAAVAEGVGIAVGVVGVGEVPLGGHVVAHERDLGAVAAKRRARQRQPLGRQLERPPDPVSPRPLVPGMVDFVEDHHPVDSQPPERVRRCGHRDLLVGGDDPVDVAGNALPGAPVRVELEPEPVCRERPLDLEMARRSDHDQAPRVLGERGPGTRQRESRLAGPRGGDREEVGTLAGAEEIECFSLPGSEDDGAHGTLDSGRSPRSAQPPRRTRAGRTPVLI